MSTASTPVDSWMIAHRNWRDRCAKAAYDAWAYRTASTTPWEYLSINEREAWFDVIAAIEDEEHYCEYHQEELACSKCEADAGAYPMCPDCDHALMCPNCEGEEAFPGV
jgi:hypothetical protein